MRLKRAAFVPAQSRRVRSHWPPGSALEVAAQSSPAALVPLAMLSATLDRHPRTTPLRPCRYAEQLEVAERRRNPEAYARKIARTERNRRRAADQSHIPPRPLYTT